jgi:energy-coupling factor transport system ATP-binding protein
MQRVDCRFSAAPVGKQNKQHQLVTVQRVSSHLSNHGFHTLATIDRDVAVEIDKVSYSYSGGTTRNVLKEVSLSVERGTFHMILGLNGCGKSTLLKCIAGMVHPDSGRIGICSDNVCGYVFQNPDNQVVLPSVYSDVAFGLGRFPKGSLSKEDVDVLVKNSLDRVGMLEYAERQASSLSGGQKQRVAIAGALVENPAILLLDELTTFLDGNDQMNVVKSVKNIVETSGRRVTALWVTHRMEELEYANAVSYMEDGKIRWTADGMTARKKMKQMGAFI